MGGAEKKNVHNRESLKAQSSFNNYPKWKQKLRENCYTRVQEDRTRLLWKLRSTQAKNHQEIVNSTFRDIVSDELQKIKVLVEDNGTSKIAPETDEIIWEYDGLHTAYQGDCEEMLLEMQRIFYEDLRVEETRKEQERSSTSWEDEEDDFLARAVYDHMNLNDEQVAKEVWCPICKHGELKENRHLISCTQCGVTLDRGDEVNLEVLQNRLAEAHSEHLDRGCRLKPEFCVETKFGLSALYIRCEPCKTFEIVI
ncbi:RPA-interacting protein B isoform X1 [Ipomoea triloba]|uniref:RPA-interacting protein B isoform X1 n=1 Tax=Ipomoea triloba TaxID=35885 RepID=UPI00125E62E9|nr:RPA-interacting protein B isoform X1 [Ipomoea triloba]